MSDIIPPAERLAATLNRARELLAPGSLESRMDAAINVDSEVVRALRRLLDVPTPEEAQLRRDQEIGEQRRKGEQQ